MWMGRSESRCLAYTVVLTSALFIICVFDIRIRAETGISTCNTFTAITALPAVAFTDVLLLWNGLGIVEQWDTGKTAFFVHRAAPTTDTTVIQGEELCLDGGHGLLEDTDDGGGAGEAWSARNVGK